MKARQTEIGGLLLIEPEIFIDPRGSFFEIFHANRYRELGLKGEFVQVNCSRSQRGVLRGLHFQKQHSQGKLIQVLHGEVYDVAVDIRFGSPTFGKSFGITLNDRNLMQLYIPPGFAHGFCVLSEEADFLYLCSDYYHNWDDGGIAWNDPDLLISWPVPSPLLSEKDQSYPRLREIPPKSLPHFTEPA